MSRGEAGPSVVGRIQSSHPAPGATWHRVRRGASCIRRLELRGSAGGQSWHGSLYLSAPALARSALPRRDRSVALGATQLYGVSGGTSDDPATQRPEEPKHLRPCDHTNMRSHDLSEADLSSVGSTPSATPARRCCSHRDATPSRCSGGSGTTPPHSRWLATSTARRDDLGELLSMQGGSSG